MAGFDPSKFLSDEEPVGRFSDLSPPVAGVAGARRLEDGTLVDEKTGEILAAWADGVDPVAGVAGVAATSLLPLTAPFASELNTMFHYPEPEWMRRGSWARLCDAVRKFTETKAADALAKGWEPIELYGVHRYPWARSLAVDGLLWIAHGRPIGKVKPQSIEILNRVGAHAHLYRAHLMTGRNRSLLMWEAFHPSNRRPDHFSDG